MDYLGGLTLDDLKQFVDRENDDDVLERFLSDALLQAQAAPPYGCGRRLLPTPLPVNTGSDTEPDWSDTADDVSESVKIRHRHHRHHRGAYRPRGHRRILVPDVREITSVAIEGSAISSDDYETEEHKGLIVQLVLEEDVLWGFDRPKTVEITGRFGYLEIPDDLKNGIYVLAARRYFERSALYADQVAIAEGGGVQKYLRQLPLATKLSFSSYTLAPAWAGLA